MQIKIFILLFIFGLCACLDQNKIDEESKLFQVEYLKGMESLREAEKDIIAWKDLRSKVEQLDVFKEGKDEDIIRLESNLTLFINNMDSFRSQLRNWKGLDNDFATMKNENIKKMSEMRLKESKELNKKIVRIHGTGNRVYESGNASYFTEN